MAPITPQNIRQMRSSLALKRFVISQNKECKVIISTLTMRVDSSKNGNAVQKVTKTLKKLNIPLVKPLVLLRNI